MEHNTSNAQQQTSWFKTKGAQITIKLIMIMGLTIFLLIPKFSILALIEERGQYYDQVNDDVSVGWGGKQVITTPVLVIPYRTIGKRQDGTTFLNDTYMVVAPESVNIEGTIDTTKRHRSIYEVLLYKSKNHLKGSFDLSDLAENGLALDILRLKEAFLAIGISDLRGLESKVEIIVNGTKHTTKAGMQKFQFQNLVSHSDEDQSTGGTIQNGLSLPLVINSDTKQLDFELDIDIKGGQRLTFLPTAQNLRVHIKSPYPHPIFGGSFLPEHTTSSQGFDAKWAILEYNKNLPKYNKDALSLVINDGSFHIGIKPLQNHYQSTYRAGKYMILVIFTLIFSCIFDRLVQRTSESISFSTCFDWICYSTLFFVLLLSFSEVIGFTKSYLLATTSTTGLTFLYGISVFKNIKSTLNVVALQLGIYGFIYTILRMEETSLLVKFDYLFCSLLKPCESTRKIKWYESGDSSILMILKYLPSNYCMMY
ncbi:MAG: cell envelope integrity protein CreD [Saprospiraceae bacterium]